MKKNSTRGSFTCSEPTLTELWSEGSTAAVEMLKGDLSAPELQIAALGAFCSSGDYPLQNRLNVGQSADELAEMVKILLLDDYYTFTGDDAPVHENYEAITQMLAEGTDRISRNGVLQETPNLGFFCYAALRAAGRMALHNDDKSASNRLFLKSMELKENLANIQPVDIYSNALGVLYDVYPEAVRYQIAMKLLNQKPASAHQFLLSSAAATKAGFGPEILEKIKKLTATETDRDVESASVATWWLSTCVLGVKPIEPGFRTFRIRPVTRNLESAVGRFPTPAGDVMVEWQKTSDAFELDVDLPQETIATLHMPPSRVIYPKIFCNAELIWEENVFEKEIIDSIIEGEEKMGRIELVLKGGHYSFRQEGAVK